MRSRHSIIQLIRTSGADAMVFTWPTVLDAHMSAATVARVQYPYHTRSLPELQALYADYQLVVRQVALADGVAVIDTAAVSDTAEQPSLFTDTIHLTCEGQARLATLAAPQIAARLSTRHL
jgi:hypothetical protein